MVLACDPTTPTIFSRISKAHSLTRCRLLWFVSYRLVLLLNRFIWLQLLTAPSGHLLRFEFLPGPPSLILQVTFRGLAVMHIEKLVSLLRVHGSLNWLSFSQALRQIFHQFRLRLKVLPFMEYPRLPLTDCRCKIGSGWEWLRGWPGGDVHTHTSIQNYIE